MSSHSIHIDHRGDVRGWSSWNIPLGNGRTVLPCERSSVLRTPAEVRRWAKKFPDMAKYHQYQIDAAIRHLEDKAAQGVA